MFGRIFDPPEITKLLSSVDEQMCQHKFSEGRLVCVRGFVRSELFDMHQSKKELPKKINVSVGGEFVSFYYGDDSLERIFLDENGDELERRYPQRGFLKGRE